MYFIPSTSWPRSVSVMHGSEPTSSDRGPSASLAAATGSAPDNDSRRGRRTPRRRRQAIRRLRRGHRRPGGPRRRPTAARRPGSHHLRHLADLAVGGRSVRRRRAGARRRESRVHGADGESPHQRRRAVPAGAIGGRRNPSAGTADRQRTRRRRECSHRSVDDLTPTSSATEGRTESQQVREPERVGGTARERRIPAGAGAREPARCAGRSQHFSDHRQQMLTMVSPMRILTGWTSRRAPASTVSPMTTCSMHYDTTGEASRPTMPTSRCSSDRPRTASPWRSVSSTTQMASRSSTPCRLDPSS